MKYIYPCSLFFVSFLIRAISFGDLHNTLHFFYFISCIDLVVILLILPWGTVYHSCCWTFFQYYSLMLLLCWYHWFGVTGLISCAWSILCGLNMMRPFYLKYRWQLPIGGSQQVYVFGIQKKSSCWTWNDGKIISISRLSTKDMELVCIVEGPI